MVDAQLTVLTGFIAGRRVALPPEGITAGRNDDVDLRFDPLQDLQVSGRHAAFTPGEDGWVLQDLGSLNGTFINGQQLSDPVYLSDRDQIQLGEGGPVLEFRLLAELAASPPLGGREKGDSRGAWRSVAILSVSASTCFRS